MWGITNVVRVPVEEDIGRDAGIMALSASVNAV
jgi:hypothetical protein